MAASVAPMYAREDENTNLLGSPGARVAGEEQGYDSLVDSKAAVGDSGYEAAVETKEGSRKALWENCKRMTWQLLRRFCWVFVGMPLVITFGAASSYFMGAVATVDLYRYVFPLDAISNHWLILGVVLFSTIIATIGCVLSMGIMACFWAYPIDMMRFFYSIFALIGLLGAGQFGMSAAQAYALGDAIKHGRIYNDVTLNTPIEAVSDASAIRFARGVVPYASLGASTWAPDLNYATQICVSPLLTEKRANLAKSRRFHTCYWAISFGSNPAKGCKAPTECLGGVCQGTTAEARQYKYYVDDAIRRSVTYRDQFEPCQDYIAVTLRDRIDLDQLQEHAYRVARMWLFGGFIAALAMSVCLTILCRRVVWWHQ